MLASLGNEGEEEKNRGRKEAGERKEGERGMEKVRERKVKVER